MSRQSESDGRSREETKQNYNIWGRVRAWLFKTNYALISGLKISFPQAVVLFLFEEMQKFAILGRLSVNPYISQSPEMVYVDAFDRFLLLDIYDVHDPNSTVVSGVLLMVQVLLLLCYLFPFSITLSAFISKYIVTVVEMTMILPSIVHSTNGMTYGANFALNGCLYVLTMGNNIVYETMQYECSFQREQENVLVRGQRSLSLRLIVLSLISVFPLLNKLLFPSSILVYVLVMVGLEIYKWNYYLKTFIYFHELFMNLKGIMLSLVISANLCYLAIYTMNNAIVAQNAMLFIATFTIFLGNFFIVFRNNIIKNTIVNKDLRGENQVSLYCVFYWHCYKQIAEKKNQLYLSSLLKKHMNDCVDLTCCCKNRQALYDSNLKTFGNPGLQPHSDKVFIRHYIKKMLREGYEQFSKSSILTFLLSYYNIEILQMITQTMELIRKLTRMQQKKQLKFSQQFMLFCLKKKTSDRIVLINHKRGNVDLESVKKFDEELVVLNASLRQSIKMYFKLWRHLQGKLNEKTLLEICKKLLELMFSIERTYKQLKGINTDSNELRTIMLFYSRLVLHDIHLLSQIKKEIKVGHERNVGLSTLDAANIQLFSSRTMSLIALENNKIRWSSKNAHAIFQYSREEFHGLTIKHLMPKYFADNHDSYVQKWKETGHHVKLNRTSYLWGVTKSGTCFSMLFYVKVIPLLHEQDFAFSCCIEKVNDQNEIVCSTYGEIYGSGKLFASAIGVDAKFLQEMRLNIQIFIPSTFDCFLEYFYPENQKLKQVKKNYQVRREGYFPESMEKVMVNLSEERLAVFDRAKGSEGYERDYLAFIKQKMQELTCNVNGQYISFLTMAYKILVFRREKREVVVLKISNMKKDNIEKFYLELERVITKLQSLTHEQQVGQNRLQTKKTDYVRSPVNPKDVKFIAHQYQRQMEQIKSMRQVYDVPNPNQKVPFDKIISIARPKTGQSNVMKHIAAHRERLVKGEPYVIKNEKVRYNVWKIKKILLKQGLISKYTFNLLIGPQMNLQTLKKSTKIDKTEENLQRRTLMDINEQKNGSDSEQESMKQNSEGGLANKDEQNQDFNSAASSATFISMTNHVKLFKQKLRSLNTPRSLWVLNLVLMLMVASGAGLLIYSVSANLSNLSNGLVQFLNNQDANVIVDGLIRGQLNINNINNNGTNFYYQLQRTMLVGEVSGLFRKQMQNRAVEQHIDSYMLSYLNLLITDKNSIYVREFIGRILDQIITNKFKISQLYFSQTINEVIKHSNDNILFGKVIAFIFVIFVVFLLCAVLFFIVTLPIVYRIQIRIKEIYELLTKISHAEKLRYFRHFNQLDQAFKKNEEVESIELSNMLQTFQGKFKHKGRGQVSEDQQPRLDSNNSRLRGDIVEDQKSTISSNRAIYIKLVVTYLVIISTFVAYYVFLNSAHTKFIQANSVFTQVFNQKTLLSFRMSQCCYQMMGYPPQAQANSATLDLVSAIYDSYHLQGVSQTYINYLTRFTISDVCALISDHLTADETVFCGMVNNKTFMGGVIDNLFYSQRKMEERLQEYYKNRNNASNPIDLSALNNPSYFYSQQFYELNIGYFFSSWMLQDLYGMIDSEMANFSSVYTTQIHIATYLTLVFMGIFAVMWIYIYLKLAENASYINAFLLLIPFDVLSQNPYIKLYIRNEFDYKSANY